MSRRPRIVVDFDGVLHAYTSKWTSSEEIHDGPVEGAIAWLQEMITKGVEVTLFTARMQEGRSAVHQAIRGWLVKHGIHEDDLHRIRIVKGKPHGTLYIDDRAFRFRGRFPTLDEVEDHVQWNKVDATRVLSADLWDAIQAARARGMEPSVIQAALVAAAAAVPKVAP